MVRALCEEIRMRRDYLGTATLRSVYFGGGTPSLLDPVELNVILQTIQQQFQVEAEAEITLEANPDDITASQTDAWSQAGINRLSIGVQSFDEEDLRWMNRAHTAEQSRAALDLALRQFANITIDLIYGLPGMTDARWKKNVETAIACGIPHLSCYALTVEEKTVLEKRIRRQQSEPVNPDRQSDQFLLLMDWMEQAGYEHYEISNFALPGWRSRHNASYWEGYPYLGIGPSAHSFDGHSRQWNIAHNALYLKALESGTLPCEREELTVSQQLNEYIMTSLRTGEGLDLRKTGSAAAELELLAAPYIAGGKILRKGERLVLTRAGKLLADGIAAALFL